MWSLVFLSQPASGDIAARLPDTEHVAAFMPCTPNPTTGFFFYVPRRDIIDLDITVEPAMTLLMSAGMVQPGGNDDSRKGSRRWPRPRGCERRASLAPDRAGELTARGLILQRRIACVRSCEFGEGECLMNFTQAITSGFQKYVNFSGRAARSEFWFWTLFVFSRQSAAAIIDMARSGSAASPVHSLVSLALFLPGLAVSVRRLHDLDRTGWWLLLVFTVIGVILLLIWDCMRGTGGPNRFGPDPLAGLP